MRKRVAFGSGILLLALLVALIVWQGSFTFGSFAPSTIEQTYVFWGISTIIFIVTVALGFMLFRTGVRLYMERQQNRAGSHIKSKLVGGALALTFLPVFFLVLFSVFVLNRNIEKWFSRPAENIRANLIEVGRAIDRETQKRISAQAELMATLSPGDYQRFCAEHEIERAELATGAGRQAVCEAPPGPGRQFSASSGGLTVYGRMPLDLAARKRDIDRSVADYDRLAIEKNNLRNLYVLLLSLITLFILFFATWIALFLARQISIPLTALLAAAQQVRKGNLGYRVHVAAIDELASLVKAFNEMTEALETNRRELENRRRFTETILESIPTGVISLGPDGSILLTNRALRQIFPQEALERASHLEDLFSREDATEIRYLMNRARRTAVASAQMEYKAERQVFHLALTLAALDEKRTSGYVLVLEDTSELLRAQKSAAWHEVARRVAHEIKNPLTPISLCAERIQRQLARRAAAPDTDRILHECAVTIAREVGSVKTLVDEFSQFSRFPAAKPVPSDLNEVVRNAMDVFRGRLDEFSVELRLAPGLPAVNIDREQFKRVVVNLVDNAAEAMQDSPLKRLDVETRATAADSIELIVADSGAGVSRDDKEKLFLPYFSTKGRGTGLGLAIVNRILADHDAVIRIEDNRPSGAVFIIDLPVAERAPAAEPSPASEVRG